VANLYRTDDLALATTLSLRKFPYTMNKVTQRKVMWEFTYTDEQEEDFLDLVADFWEYCAEVEPRTFSLRWAEMRKELFVLIPPGRQSVSAATS
jgi:hypothetical protein